jgi:hypothetical protein
VLQELTPGRGNSFSFVDGRVNGREVFVTTRKPGKRGRPRKKDIDDTVETPKRGRPRTRGSATPSGTPRTPKKKSPGKQNTPREKADEIEVEDIEVVDVVHGTETSQADGESVCGYFEGQGGFSDGDGFQETEYEVETPTHGPQTPTQSYRNETPLPIEPFRSFRSSPPSSPVYEEYQVPIPTSSSPMKPPSQGLPSPTPSDDPETARYTSNRIPQIQTPLEQMKRRRARSRSASRERRLSIAPIPSWQGLPSTPRRTTRDSDSEEQRSLSTRSTTHDDTLRAEVPVVEVRQTLYSEGMTPVRNWAAEIAEGAFLFDKSAAKITLPTPTLGTSSRPVTIEDDNSDDHENDYGQNYDSESDVEELLSLRNPQLARLREARGNPIVITSSPPVQSTQVHYQWKTIVDPEELVDPESPLRSHETRLSSESPVSQGSPISQKVPMSHLHLSPPRQVSPARSIITELGDDVVDISSLSPLAAKRAANILLRSEYYSKVTFDDEQGGRIWEAATQAAGEYELSRVDIPTDDSEESQDELDELDEDVVEDGDEVDEVEDSEEGQDILESPPMVRPPRISYGEWTKIDWKRLEKCLDHVDGEMPDAIDLFQERYIGRKREEVEMRCRAVMLARRRRVLEGRNVGFILSTRE